MLNLELFAVCANVCSNLIADSWLQNATKQLNTSILVTGLMRKNIYSASVLGNSVAVGGHRCQLFAGTGGKIAGTITDAQTGDPLVGVNIIVEELQTGASSDADGYFLSWIASGQIHGFIFICRIQNTHQNRYFGGYGSHNCGECDAGILTIEGAEVTATGQRDIVEKI